MNRGILFLVALMSLVFIIPLEVLAAARVPAVIIATGIAEWFGLPLNFETFVWWLIVLAFCLAGGTFGLMMKHYQQANWKFGPEDLVYYGMAISASMLFLVMQTPPDMCFIYSAGLNGGLGVIRNMYDKRNNTPTTTA